MEQLWLTQDKTKLLVLIKVDDNAALYGRLGAIVEDAQQIEHAKISGRTYYRLKCTVTDSNYNQLVYGEKAGTYSQSAFVNNMGESRNGDFVVTFDGTDEKKIFNWYEIINNPSSLVFFGAPLSQSRQFDKLWPTMKSANTLYNWFRCMYGIVA